MKVTQYTKHCAILCPISMIKICYRTMGYIGLFIMHTYFLTTGTLAFG